MPDTKFISQDNGDIFATRKSDDFLLGVWFHKKSEGTFRISEVGAAIGYPSVIPFTGETGKLTDLTEWVELMRELKPEGPIDFQKNPAGWIRTQEDIMTAIQQGKLITAVNLLRPRQGLGIHEAKYWVENVAGYKWRSGM